MWEVILCCQGSGFRDSRVHDEGTMVLQNVRKPCLSDTASHPRWPESLYKAC